MPSHGCAWRADGSDNFVAHSLRADGFDASEDGTDRGTPIVPDVAWALQERDSKGADSSTKDVHLIPVAFKPCGQDGLTPDSISPPLTNSDGGGHSAVAFQPRIARNGRGDMGDMVNALQAQSGQTGKGDAAPCVAGDFGVRRLTPKECARLQGFPDDYLDVVHNGKPAADGPKYKALGNSMAVPVVRWILQRIQSVNSLP